jgi:DNA-binding MarR family transcriptional regulator
VTLNTTEPEQDARRHLTDELLDELTTWQPRERMSAFKAWLRGSLSLIHLHVLTVLEAEGSLPMSHLAESLDVSVASAMGIVTRMEERGLVERKHDEADRRIVMVSLTDAGRNVFREMEQVRRFGLRKLLGQLSEEELAGFLTGLRAMKKARAAFGNEDPGAIMRHAHALCGHVGRHVSPTIAHSGPSSEPTR